MGVDVPTKRLRGLMGACARSTPSAAVASVVPRALDDICVGYMGLLAGSKDISVDPPIATFSRSTSPGTSTSLYLQLLTIPVKYHYSCSSSSPSNMETNLAATTAARKERLIALRKRKEATDKGESTGGP